MPHYYDVSYCDSFAEPEIEEEENFPEYNQGDVVLINIKQNERTVVHKGIYLYSVQGEVLMHRVETWTGAGCVDVISENIY